MKTLAALALTVSALACATGGGMSTRPENIPALEQRVAEQPDNMDAATSLGVAYYNASRYDDARGTLARVIDSGSTTGTAYLYLGLANEELKDWNAARTAYERYIDVGGAGSAKEQVRARLALVARQQLKQDARLVLEREQQLSQEPPAPRTVAVMPFQMVGTSEEMAPLQTALTDMIITDLSVSPAITSIERVKINAMIDEMLLTQAGLAEQNTGARVGRLLKAEHVVQGVLAQSGERQLRMDATVLNTARASTAGTFGQNQALDAIFDLEKEIVFNIFSTIGVTLTAAERERINENRTGNLLAFLAYGRGLNELDRGNYQQATSFFRQASQLDPRFAPAQAQQQESAQLQQAEQVSTGDIAQAGSPEVSAAPVGASDMLASVTNEVAPSPVTQTQPSAPVTDQGTTTQQNQSGNPLTSQGQTSSVTTAVKAKVQIRICNPTKGCS